MADLEIACFSFSGRFGNTLLNRVVSNRRVKTRPSSIVGFNTRGKPDLRLLSLAVVVVVAASCLHPYLLNLLRA